ncbi:hypothetical protein QTH97_32995 [Variovorax sp. J22R24]|uniref:hypothetical protein n=1 Tax=Variovorax gracilis TaxID=3053502 RepID=UPI002578FF25|nr:hypothetical protein [Variovorax sp. J22R24]MDM0109774.1 hypothetical protein [Variovorax sp. J22R24]
METRTLVMAGVVAAFAASATLAEAAGRCFPRQQCQAGQQASPSAPDDGPVPEVSGASAAGTESGGRLPLIAPINSLPGGQTYGRWAVEWQQWAVSMSKASNPLLSVMETHPERCAHRQVGRVWFLGGAILGETNADRVCEVPAGKALFFPMINTAYYAFLNDSEETRTEAFVRNAGNCTVPAEITIWIDGVKVPRPTRYFTGPSGSPSPIFNAQLPPDNIFKLDTAAATDLAFSPSAEQGYYLFIYPMSPGFHLIRWVAHGCLPDFVQEITYRLTVLPR